MVSLCDVLGTRCSIQYYPWYAIVVVCLSMDGLEDKGASYVVKGSLAQAAYYSERNYNFFNETGL